jgi:glutamate 5-kinase
MSTTSDDSISRNDFKNFKRILIKVGTTVVTHNTGVIALGRIAYVVEQKSLNERQQRSSSGHFR